MTLSEQTKKLQEFITKTPNPNDISKEELPQIYQNFIDTITDHNHLYYIDSQPIISDFEYDQLFSYLKTIEENNPDIISGNSPTQILTGQLSEEFQKASHKIPLLSLENSYNAEDIRQWAQKIKKLAEKYGEYQRKYLLEPKFDGLSVEFIFKEGKFIQAITRGDGKIGEDITQNVFMISSFPKTISILEEAHFRGEVMMPKTQFKKLNQEREKAGKTLFANTRNAASGSLKLLDSTEVGKRGLIVAIYEQLYGPQVNRGQLGLPTFNLPEKYRITSDIEELISWCLNPKIKQFLDSQDIDFDGLVIKIYNESNSTNNFLPQGGANNQGKESLRKILGNTEHHPRWAIAYKFPAQQIVSQIESVDFQVGRTGIITPVANITPVQLSGATISRVSLHNFDFIKSKQIKNKDFIRVQRSGEVIPYIVSSIKERRSGAETHITPPLFCPKCGGPIANIDIHYYCNNPECPAQLKEKIVHFASRDAMNIEGLGESVVDILVDQKIFTSIIDIYELSTNINKQMILRKFPNFGEKRVAELILQIEQSKNQPLRKIINALGIPNIGKKLAQDLANYLKTKRTHTLDELIDTFNQEEIETVYGVGKKIMEELRIYIDNPKSLKLLHELQNYGISFDTTKSPNIGNQEGKIHFSITGTFPIPRNKIIKELEKQNYLYDETPTSTTSIMLIGEKAGAKEEKAKNMGIKTYNDRNSIKKIFGINEDIQITIKQKIIQKGLF